MISKSRIIYCAGPNTIKRNSNLPGRRGSITFTTFTRHGTHEFGKAREARWFVDTVDADRKRRRAQRRARRITRLNR